MFVYALTNSVNEKVYVGQHSGDDLDRYFKRCHVRMAFSKKEGHRLICRAIRKHGPDNFFISPLVVCGSKKEMDDWEIFFIKAFNSTHPDVGYNLAAGGGGTVGLRPSLETRLKLSAAKAGRRPSARNIAGLIERNKRGPSDAVRASMSAAQKKRFQSPEEREKRSQSAKASWIKNESWWVEERARRAVVAS